jgi:hypothetical protein
MPANPIQLPMLGKTPKPPEPGIYFDMSFETYLDAPAVGSSLLFDVLVDPYLAWVRSWMNPHKKEREAEHLLYGKAFHCRLLEGAAAYDERFFVEPEKADFEHLIVTDDDIRAAIAEFEETPVKGNKPERVRQLLELWPEAPMWDAIVAQAARDAAGRTIIKGEWHRKFEDSAAFVEADPELRELLTGGHPEVSLFWHCPQTGILKKARADYLKLTGFVDVKTFANQHEKSPLKAIPKAIANEQYPFQPSHYLEGAQAVKWLIRQHGADAIVTPDDVGYAEQYEWATEWARSEEPDGWTWLFIQKGDAPIAVGWEYDVDGMLREQFDMFAADASGRFAELCERFGAEPWIEHHGIVRGEDQRIPAYVMEI